MDLLNPLFISIVLFGTVTSYTDIRYGKVKNIVIVLMLFTGFFLNLFFTNLLTKASLNLRADFMQTIINFFVTLGFGFFLWLAGLWSEGDAKLFLGYSLLLPVFTYKHGYIMYFPALNILINTFIPAAFFFILMSLVKIDAKLLKWHAKQTFEKNNIINIILTIFVLSFLTKSLFGYIKFKPDLLLNLLILFIFMEVIKSIKFLSSSKVLAAASLLIIIFYFNSIMTIQFVEGVFIAMIFIFPMAILLSYSIEHSLVEPVNVENLREGMILGEPVDRKNNYSKEEPKTFTTMYGLLKTIKESLLSDNPSRLTAGDIKKMISLKKSGKLGYKNVKIAKTIPFAPFMLFGVLLTYFLQGSIFYYLLL